jgi:hypothetical protein
MRKLKGLFFVFIVLGFNKGFAQSYQDEDEHPVSMNFSEIALLSIMPNHNAITIEVSTPKTAGEPPIASFNSNEGNTKWLNYTSALSSFKKSRKILVQISDGKVPDGMLLKVETSSYTGNGKGSHGTAAGIVTLSTKSALLIANIKGAYTGIGVNSGHKLTYSVELTDPNKIIALQESDVQITYTITDQ